MYEFIQNLHSGIAYVALLMLIIVVLNAAFAAINKKEFTSRDRKIALFGLIFAHIQLLIGLILYFVSPLGYPSISTMGMGEVMKNPELRQMAVEHPMINIIAIILITIGWSKHKKASTPKAKFNNILIFYALGLMLILSRIPWKTWM
jgi:amino acid transporter